MHLLLSGATGYLGKHLLAGLLHAGHMVTALVRGGDRQRLLNALRPFALPPALVDSTRLGVVAADLAAPGADINGPTRAALALTRPAAFVHAAGLTRFETRLADELHTQNLAGTQHAWQLAEALALPLFVHISTAYVAGRAATPFEPGHLDLGQDFNNPYEATKFAAEQWLRARAAGQGPTLVVQRPSIVVGGHPIGANQSVSTLYTFMKAVQFIRECCRRDAECGRQAFATLGVRRDGENFHVPVRVAANPASTVNLVAIDDVVDDLLATLTAPVAQTRQITGHAYRLADIAHAITTTMRLSGVSLVDDTAFDTRPRNAIETHFHRVTQVYAPYLFGTPRFAPRACARRIDLQALTREYLRERSASDDRRRSRHRAPRPPARLGTLALDTLGINEPGDYFRALVEGAVGGHFLARHDYVDARVGFSLRGTPACEVTLRFKDGRATALPADAAASADCRYELDAALFMRIVHGAADLRASFLAGKVRITGDTELALKFGALLGMYYSRLDEHLIAELSA